MEAGLALKVRRPESQALAFFRKIFGKTRFAAPSWVGEGRRSLTVVPNRVL